MKTSEIYNKLEEIYSNLPNNTAIEQFILLIAVNLEKESYNSIKDYQDCLKINKKTKEIFNWSNL